MGNNKTKLRTKLTKFLGREAASKQETVIREAASKQETVTREAASKQKTVTREAASKLKMKDFIQKQISFAVIRVYLLIRK